MTDSYPEGLGAFLQSPGGSGAGSCGLFGAEVALLLYENAAEKGLVKLMVTLVIKRGPASVSKRTVTRLRGVSTHCF